MVQEIGSGARAAAKRARNHGPLGFTMWLTVVDAKSTPNGNQLTV
jgi:hypothetical protein